MHSKECKGCAEILQEPTKKGSKRSVGKGKQPTTKRTQSQVVNQRELLTRSQQVRYTSPDDEEGLHDADDEIQGYLCVSVDPRRSGSAEGGENFIITAKELRLSLQAQCEEEDQTVWMTTGQVGFPTTVVEGEIDDDLDRQRGNLRPDVFTRRYRSSFSRDNRNCQCKTKPHQWQKVGLWNWKANGVPRRHAWRIRTGAQTITKIPPGSLILSP